MAAPVDDGAWHLDRKVPIALIATIVIQTMAIVWWAAKTDARVDQLERWQAASLPLSERVIRLEEKIGVVQQGITEIKQLVTARPVQPHDNR